MNRANVYCRPDDIYSACAIAGLLDYSLPWPLIASFAEAIKLGANGPFISPKSLASPATHKQTFLLLFLLLLLEFPTDFWTPKEMGTAASQSS